MADDGSTIIIKRIKKGGHGHHGGAWKVAYADFVTAMMAFFLLLWLLNATSDEAKQGIADYFAPTTGLKDAMGIGFQGGETPYREGNEISDKAPVGIVYGGIPSGPSQETENQRENVLESEKDSQLFDEAADAIKRAFEENPNLEEFRDFVLLEQTPEGLKITISDMYSNPMFEAGGFQLSHAGQQILSVLSEIIRKLPKRISITGHTDSAPLNKGNYSNWELSADRANAARRFMMSKGMETEQVAKVVGRAEQEPLLPDDPLNPLNRRIVIILLRDALLSLTEAYKPATRNLLSAPKVELNPKPKEEPKTPKNALEASDGLSQKDREWANDINRGPRATAGTPQPGTPSGAGPQISSGPASIFSPPAATAAPSPTAPAPGTATPAAPTPAAPAPQAQ